MRMWHEVPGTERTKEGEHLRAERSDGAAWQRTAPAGDYRIADLFSTGPLLERTITYFVENRAPKQAPAPELGYCPSCGHELPLRTLVRPLTRAIVDEMLEHLQEPEQPEAPKPPTDDRPVFGDKPSW